MYTSGLGDIATSSGAQNLHVKSTILTNDLIEESPSPLAFDRKRAKSYPSERPSEPIPLLELPQQSQPIEEEEENEVSLLTQYIGWMATVSTMFNKHKKNCDIGILKGQGSAHIS